MRLPLQHADDDSVSRSTTRPARSSLTFSTELRIGTSTPSLRANARSALRSFGKQLPPKPMPALRYETAPAKLRLAIAVWALPNTCRDGRRA